MFNIQVYGHKMALKSGQIDKHIVTHDISVQFYVIKLHGHRKKCYSRKLGCPNTFEVENEVKDLRKIVIRPSTTEDHG